MVQFQLVDILSDDVPNDSNGKDFQVSLYGKTRSNQSIICNVIGFKPYFYLKIPESWSPITVTRFLKEAGDNDKGSIDRTIESYVSGYNKHQPINDLQKIKEASLILCKELYGFKCHPDKTVMQYKFVKLEFSSHIAMGKYSEAIRKKYSLLQRQQRQETTQYHNLFKEWLNLDKDEVCDSHLYESNIHPIIRFIHTCKIQPANWINVDIVEDELYTNPLFPQVDVVLDDIHYTSVLPIIEDSISPYVIASFDIECDSSHGDFPLPTKDCKKLAIDIYDSLHRAHEKNVPKDTLLNYIPYCIHAAFDDDKHTLLKDISPYLDINPIYSVKNKKPSHTAVKQCVLLFHNDNFIEQFYNIKKRDTVINDITKHLNQLKDEQGSIITIEGDKVIQIGTVFHRYGEEQPYKRHILVIAPQDNLPDEEICDPLDTIEVVPCKNEKSLLLGWKDIMKSEDPDFVTGYNIVGFDFAYMYDRMNTYCRFCTGKWCDRQCPLNQFLNLGKINTTCWEACYHRNKKCQEKKQKTMTFGSSDFKRYLHMDGRIIYDLQKEVEKGHNLESYKLDNVAAHFMRGKIKGIVSHKRVNQSGSVSFKTMLFTTEFGNLKIGDYVSLRLHSNIGETYYKDAKKFKISNIVKAHDKSYIQLIRTYMKFDEEIFDKKTVSTWDPNESEFFKIEWCLMKDDVSPQDIFEKHKSGGPAGRAEVAKYCIQDCELCINLTLNLDIIPNNIAMANVCSVPQSYIYLRGQGAKIFSLIAKECDLNDIRIPTLDRPFNPRDCTREFNDALKDESFYDLVKGEEDDIKLKYYLIREDCKRWSDYETPPVKDIKNELTEFDDMIKGKSKVVVGDAEEGDAEEGNKPYDIYKIMNKFDEIMHPPPRDGYEGAIVLDPESGIYLDDPVGVVDYASLYPSSIIEKNISHDTLIEDPQYLKYVDYETITYDKYTYEEEEGKITISKKIDKDEPTITCHFLKKEDGTPLGIIPTVVQHLLAQRKATKKRLKAETNDFKRSVLDGLQLAYKLVANSVYGQMGARTSPIYKNKLAACTTAIGRERIYDARDGVELGWWKESKWAVANGCRPPKVIYGDTDSVFIKWQRYKNGQLLEGKEALEFCIECGKDAGEWITQTKLQKPQDLEYEKTFYPFILISKKRYTADKYEFDTSECKRNSMGIVLKRRDNAPIVKHVFGNVIEKIMIDKDLDKSVEWLKQTLADIRSGKFPMSYFIITKSLRGYYKNPKGIAHKVLAERMGERDPGNKPKPGDRMPFAYRVLEEHLLKDKDNKYKSGPRKGQFRDLKVLQGDRIEDPEFIKKNNLDLDYEFYITNQIMNPVKQVLDLEMDADVTSKIFAN